MTEIDNLVMENLRAIRKELAEVKDGQASARVEISTLGQQVAGLTTAVYAGHDHFSILEQRIERIERRLELTG